MSFKVIIPARYHSTRLPAKPLADINGKPMIQRVYEQVLLSEAEQIIIATDHPQIAQVCESFGANVCMTSLHHQSGTERLSEVVALMQMEPEQIIVNVQGDEPLIPPSVINQVAKNLAQNPQADMATLATSVHEYQHLFDPNIVKVLWDAQNMAIYFSRVPIPWARDEFPQKKLPNEQAYYRHIGLYAYRAGFLRLYTSLTETSIEKTEKLEQLRILWHGHKIHVDQAIDIPPIGIDTAEDLARVCHLLAH